VGGGEAADRMARGLSAGVRLPEPPAAGLARLTGSPAVVARAVTRRAWRAWPLATGISPGSVPRSRGPASRI